MRKKVGEWKSERGDAEGSKVFILAVRAAKSIVDCDRSGRRAEKVYGRRQGAYDLYARYQITRTTSGRQEREHDDRMDRVLSTTSTSQQPTFPSIFEASLENRQVASASQTARRPALPSSGLPLAGMLFLKCRQQRTLEKSSFQ